MAADHRWSAAVAAFWDPTGPRRGGDLYNGYVYRDGVLAGVVSATVDTTYDENFLQERLTTVLDDAERSTIIDFPDRFATASWDVSPTFTFRDGCFTGFPRRPRRSCGPRP